MESIEIISKLFTGKKIKHRGQHFTMESARLYTLPATPPPIYVATSGPIMAYRTGKFTDGLITVGAADEKLKMLIERFETGAREAGKDPASMPKTPPDQGLLRADRGGSDRGGGEGLAERGHGLSQGRYP